MKAVTLANKTYSVEEIKDLFCMYDKETMLFSTIINLNQIYYKNYLDYLNVIQRIPSIFNAILLFSNGTNKSISTPEMNYTFDALSSIETTDIDKNNMEVELAKIYTLANHGSEYSAYVQARIEYHHNWIVNKGIQSTFQEISKVNLEDFGLVFFGAFSIALKSNKAEFIDKSFFFKNTIYSEEQINQIYDLIRKNFSITIDEAQKQTIEELNKSGKAFSKSFSVFFDKPFIDIDGRLYSVAPHLITNELISIWSKFYILEYSRINNITKNIYQNEVSQQLGYAFENYITDLIKQVYPRSETDPPQGDVVENKGTDLINLQKNIPLLVEIHKAVIDKSLIHDFDEEKLKKFIDKKIIEKIKQTFKWMKSHKYIYKNYNLLRKFKNIQIVVVIAEDPVFIDLNISKTYLLKRVNEVWFEVTDIDKKIKEKNVFVIGALGIEYLVTLCIEKQLDFSLILFEYKKYIKATPDLKVLSADNMSIRDYFTAWLLSRYNLKNIENEELIKLSDSFMNKLTSVFKAK